MSLKSQYIICIAFLSFTVGILVDHYLMTKDLSTEIALEVTPQLVLLQMEPQPTRERKVVPKQEFVPAIDEEELICLAKNIYFEARGENRLGKLAVAHVTINRVNSPRFPGTICNVVYQAVYSKWWYENHGRLVPVRNKCQFSWYCDGKSDTVRNERAWNDSIDVARDVILGLTDDPTHGAKWYYNPDLASPNWSASFVKTAMVGNHKFMN